MDLVEYYRKSDTVVGIAKILFNEIGNKYDSKKISQLAKTTSGGTPNRGHNEYYGGNIPWLKSGELNDAYIEKSEEFITEEGLKNSSATLFKKDTLLVAMYGATAGKTGILKLDATTNQAVCGFYELNGIERDYLYWFLRQYRIDFILQSKGGAQPNISQTVIKNTLIPFPPIEIQKQIIQFLDTVEKENSINADYDFIDDNFDKNVTKYFGVRNTNETLEKGFKTQSQLLSQLRQSILQEAIQGKLTENWRAENPNTEPASELLKRIKTEKEKTAKTRAERSRSKGKKSSLPEITENEIPFELPETWVWCRLGEMSINRDGERKPISQAERNNRQKIYDYYGASGVIDKIDNFTHEGELLLIGEDGANLVTRSTPIAFLAKGKFWVNNHAHVLETVDRITLDYLRIYINAIDLKPFITGGFQPKLNQNNLNNIPIPLPPLSEQHAIVEQVEKLLGKCTALQTEIENLNTYSKTLLKALFAETFATEKI